MLVDKTAPPAVRTTPERPATAWWPVGGVAVLTVLILFVTSGHYGYHRDELYFRMLAMHPAWGYVDQPPLTPMLMRLAIEVFGDHVWAIRVPFELLIGAAAIVAALIAREVGGGRVAQTLAALAMLTVFPLDAGHASLTAGPDLLVWGLVILLAMRALLRDRPRLWLAVGAVVGVGFYNKLLIVLLLLMLAAGLLAVGPRRVLWSGWVWAGVGLALLVGLPNLIYQVANDFPQLDMASALAENKGADARANMLPLQLLMFGPPYVPIWIAGLVTLLRDRRLRPVRALAVAYPLMVVVLLAIAGQPYYSAGLLAAVYAIGCAPTERWFGRGSWRRVLVVAAVVVNVAASLVIALPLVPVRQLGGTPIPEINQVARDSVGWPTYVRQIAHVYYMDVPPEDRPHTVILTSNYGEAGAVDRYGKVFGLPTVYSGQNELYHLRRPPDDATVVIFVFQGPIEPLLTMFESCEKKGRLDNEVDVDNEENERAYLYVCRTPREPWAKLWPRMQHFD